MNELTPYQKLDKVLEYISHSDLNDSGNDRVTIHGSFEKHTQIKIGATEFLKILEHLTHDKFLKKEIGIKGTHTYLLTYAGWITVDRKVGYVATNEKDRREKKT